MSSANLSKNLERNAHGGVQSQNLFGHTPIIKEATSSPWLKQQKLQRVIGTADARKRGTQPNNNTAHFERLNQTTENVGVAAKGNMSIGGFESDTYAQNT